MKINHIKVGDIVNSISKTHAFNLPKLYAVNTSDIEKGNMLNPQLLPVEELKGQFKKTIENDDILFSEIRPANERYAIVKVENPNNYVVSTKLMVLRIFNPNVDLLYFYYWLTNRNMLNILQNRAENRICSFPQITFELLSNYLVPVPEISAQRKISILLKSLDSKIALNNKIIAELESMAKTLYDYWFLQFDFPDKNGKPYKSSGGKMIYNEELKREIPAEWSVGKVSDICDFENGDRGTNYPSKKDFVDNGIPFVTGGMIDNNSIMYDSLNYITECKYQQLRAGKAVEGDILLTLRGSLAKCVYSPFDKLAIASALVIVRPKECISNCFLYHFLTSLYFKELCFNYDNGSVQANLSVNVISSFDCCIPDSSVILKWNSIVEKSDRMICNLQKENHSLALLRDFLLPMLMNGQVTFRERE